MHIFAKMIMEMESAQSHVAKMDCKVLNLFHYITA